VALLSFLARAVYIDQTSIRSRGVIILVTLRYLAWYSTIGRVEVVTVVIGICNLIGYVVSGAVLGVWAEYIMLATNGTEAVVNESRA